MTKHTDAFYANITERLITAMEAGVLPWRKPWRGGGAVLPLRACGTAYRGINTLALWFRAEDAGFSGAHWMTYRQATELGGQVRRGEKGTKVIKYGTRVLDGASANDTTDSGSDASDATRCAGFIRVYSVFNTDQIDGLPETYAPPSPGIDTGVAPIEAYERFFAATGLTIEIRGTRACYVPSTDTIEMPPHARFDDAHAFYRVLSHEAAHATGHASRLDRFPAKQTPRATALEELCAELAAVFLGARIGLEPAEDNAAGYLQHWIDQLSENPAVLFKTVTEAQAAVDWLITPAGPDALPKHAPAIERIAA